MQRLSFDESFACLSGAPLSSTDLARLRDWIDGIRDPAECLTLIIAAAAGEPCPHCACAHLQRCGVASDCNGATLDFHTGRGLVTAAQLRTCLLPVLPGDGLLISDGTAAYARFVASAGIMHESVNVLAAQRGRGAIHIQNVNSWHSRFKNWPVRFTWPAATCRTILDGSDD